MDTRFLRVHPATQAWWEQRDLCEKCKHMILREGNEGESIMRCAVTTPTTGNEGIQAMRQIRRIDKMYCIDARLEGQACGPEGRLFVAVPAGAA